MLHKTPLALVNVPQKQVDRQGASLELPQAHEQLEKAKSKCISGKNTVEILSKPVEAVLQVKG